MSKRFHERRAAQRLEEQAERQRIAAEASGRPVDARSARKAPKGQANRWPMQNEFLDVHAGGMGRLDALVWLMLYRDARNGTACTGMTDIARRLKTTRRSVVRAINHLVSAGYLTILHRGSAKGSPSRYGFELPAN